MSMFYGVRNRLLLRKVRTLNDDEEVITEMPELDTCKCGGKPEIKHGYHKECLDFGVLVWVQCPKCGISSRQVVERDDSDLQKVVAEWNNEERFKCKKEVTDKWIVKEK